MSFLARNLDALPAVAPTISAPVSPVVPIEHLQSRTGKPTARYGGLLLHSRFDPQREAIRAVENGSADSCSAAVFFGFGFGYGASRPMAGSFIARNPWDRTSSISTVRLLGWWWR